MPTQKFKLITALFLSIANISTLKASESLADEAVQQKALIYKIVDFESNNNYHAPIPTIDEATAFLRYVKHNPGFEAEGLSDEKVHSIRVLANSAVNKEDQLDLDLNMSSTNLKVLPRFLGALVYLQNLLLDHNEISDITPLKSLTHLKCLELHHNKISDLQPLESLTNLKYLGLNHNKISDLQPLESLKQLKMLHISMNEAVNTPEKKNLALAKFSMVQRISVVEQEWVNPVN